MKLEHYIEAGGRRLRCGYTTGTCAAGAARLAAEALLTGRFPALARVETPAGLTVELEPEEPRLERDWASCAVRKDGGDDVDATHGALIFARVSLLPRGIEIDGGEGVGRVTRAGLDQPVGQAAINSVPRSMIARQLRGALEEHGKDCGLRAVISVPEGRAIAAKTFNPRLGIVGGISILGTSGLVRPMSRQALVDTTRAELSVHAAAGERDILMTPGNYGRDFAQEQLGLDLNRAVECSNYIGEALDSCAALGLRSVLLVGHIGKLCKLAAGVFDTHSRTADSRREVFVTHAALAGGKRELLEALYHSVTTDQCLELLTQAGLQEPVLAGITAAAGENLRRRAAAVQAEAILFSNQYGLLGQTPGAGELVERLREKFPVSPI